MSLNVNTYELLIEAVLDYAIYMLDVDGRVASWNPGAARIKGYTAAEIMGAHFSCFYTPEDRAAGIPAEALRLATDTGRFTTEAWRVRKDGSRFWAMVVIDPIRRDGALVGFAKVTRDLTERREAQLLLEESREQLFQSQKMEAVGQLSGGLAHDFNNLLTGIIGSLDLIRTRVEQGRFESIEPYIAIAQSAANRAAALTHRLLAFARRQTLISRSIDANVLIGGMEELIQRSVGPAIAVRTVRAGALTATLCDPNQLENAILNLCINARDAMPDGGQLTIETAMETLDARAARLHDIPPGPYVTVGVTDTGTGMPPEVAARAFDPFFTTKPSGQGTGLGLSMIYGFARQSGGQARILSAVGKGTTVRLYLPAHEGAAEDADADAAPAAPAPRAAGGEAVLVVDDEPGVRLLVADVLEDLGYAALVAGDGEEGLGVLESGARIDLLITDVGLPGGLNGRQMADAARRRRPTLKVLFITGYAENAAIGEGQLDAGMHVLTKPFTMESLAARIRSVLSGP